MKTTYILFLTISIMLASCKLGTKDAPKTTTVINIAKDSLSEVKTESKSLSLEPIQLDNFLYVDLLSQFDSSEDYYVSLYFKNEHSDSVYTDLINSSELIIEGFDETRKRLDINKVRQHLIINGLDTLLVLNEHQEIIDSVFRKDYEYYETMIEGSFIASYKTEPNLNGKVIISSVGFIESNLNKSPELNTDSIYLNQILDRTAFNVSYVYLFTSFTTGNDTISCLSFSDYEGHKDCLYLLKNKEITDSLINEFVIIDMKEVPLANNNEAYYVAQCAVPETDNMWNSLIGIDLSNSKFKFHPGNRIKKTGANKPQ